jgi:hypothetical protein
MKDLTFPIFIGVVVYAASQYFLKLILEPIIEFRKHLSEISHTVLLHQVVILSGDANDKELQGRLSALSAKLRSSVYLIPYYSLLNKLRIFGIPKKENILLACQQLNRLSFKVLKLEKDPSRVANENEASLKEISRLLNIETTYVQEEK